MSFALDQWAPYICRRAGLGPWEHHIHVEGGAYRHFGPCVDHHDPDDMPAGWDLGCTAVDNPVDREKIEQ